VAILAADGRVREWVGTHRDVTEQKAAAAALRQARAELAHANRVMTVGELTATIAHEVSQPLAALVANASACQHLLARPQPDLEEVTEAVGDIAREGKRAGDVITRIRALLRRGMPEREELRMDEVLWEILLLMQSELRFRNVSLATEMAVDLPPVLGDRVQLQQVILNLILNALDAMHEVEGRTRLLHIGTRVAEPGWVEIWIRDTGCGLEAEQLPRLFEPFYTTKAEGIGLGLSIAQTISEGHEGRLWATSNGDGGATFHFALPAKGAAASCLQNPPLRA
jgi:C4-dicarboxylate-specific signal transduction histidine kinase